MKARDVFVATRQGEPKRSRRSGLLATAVVSALALALVGAPNAGAVQFQNTGSFSNSNMKLPQHVSVDPSSGNVYVADFGDPFITLTPGAVYRYDANGNPLSPASMGSDLFSGVAVEQGADHTVYTFGFDSGTFAAQIGAFTSAGAAVGSPFPFSVDESSAAQIASDSAGYIYFPDQTTNTVKKYTSAGVAGTPAEFVCEGTDCDSTPFSAPASVATDSAGNVYVVDRGPDKRVVKFGASGVFQSVFSSSEALDIAVDTSTDTVFLSIVGGEVIALDASGNVVGSIPAADLNGGGSAVAVNPTTETLYVLTGQGASAAVKIFQILPAPAATTGAASNITADSATLGATVNPKGVISTDCHLEYTDDADFQANGWTNASSEDCDPLPFNESSEVDVSADVAGLSASTTYDYRIVESTGGGTTNGDPVQFTTLAPKPTVAGEAAGSITQHAATLSGTVNPNGAATTCEFQYGASTSYGTTVPCTTNPGSGSSAVAVTIPALSSLSAGTTYHYRINATNGGGTTNGADHTFATLADTCETNAALCPPPVNPPPVNPPPVNPPTNPAAYKVCVKKASKAYRKAKAHNDKQAATKKKQAIKKCKARFL